MKVSELLNPLPDDAPWPPITTWPTSSPTNTPPARPCLNPTQSRVCIGKPRRRFTPDEDRVIIRGVENDLTWGEIALLLVDRKRATCYNRYQTLIGKRKSRPNATPPIPSDGESACSPNPLSPTDSYTGQHTTTKQLVNTNMLPIQQQKKESCHEFVHHHPPLFSYSPYSP